MNRLQSELHRLYLLPDAGSSGTLRAPVLELARPAEWERLSAVWRGVQVDLQLPAPAIAVSGTDGLQLWFSLAEPVGEARAAEFLARLCERYLPDVAPARLRTLPSIAALSDRAARVPAQQEADGNWSAFVAPGLAPVFADTPWLDIPPSDEGQADLLGRVESIAPAAFDAAMQVLRPIVSVAAARSPDSGSASPDVDPRRFLQQVLNDETAPLALRVEAAKALLPFAKR